MFAVDTGWRAYEAADVDAVIALLTDDVFISMPPIPLEYAGREAVARFIGALFGAGRRFELAPTRANGQPAFAAYVRGEASGLLVLTVAGARISAITRFERDVLEAFAMPSRLGSPP
jgi:RNA polymerase sigma-70 factor (ECF subfamily)